MLTIRREQMQVLEAHMQRVFEARLARRLVANFPDKAKAMFPLTDGSNQAAVAAYVHQAVRKAQGFGLSAAPDVAALIDLMMTLGTDFEHQPDYLWMLKILNSKAIPPASRVRVIFQRFPLRHPDRGPLIYPLEKEL